MSTNKDVSLLYTMSTTDSQEGSGLVRHSPSPKIQPSVPKYIAKYQQRILGILYTRLGLTKSYARLLTSSLASETIIFYRNQAYTDEQILKDILPADFESRLRKTYFRKYKRIFSPIQNTCYDDDQLRNIIIEYATGKYDPIGKKDVPYLYNPTQINEVYTLPKLFNAKYKHVNVPQTQDMSSRISEIIKQYNFDPSSCLYHATNWRSAKNILMEGPSFYHGSPCQDFGASPSFYVTNDLSLALQWGQRRGTHWFGEICVLVFVNPEISSMKSKSFSIPDEEWKKLTWKSRNCVKNNLDAYDYVSGPMLANVQHVKNAKKPTSVAHSPVKWQMASKTHASDKALWDSLEFAVWHGLARPYGARFAIDV